MRRITSTQGSSCCKSLRGFHLLSKAGSAVSGELLHFSETTGGNGSWAPSWLLVVPSSRRARAQSHQRWGRLGLGQGEGGEKTPQIALFLPR